MRILRRSLLCVVTLACPCPRGGAAAGQAVELPVVARIDVGLNPHQISFGPAGDRAFIAVAGSDRIVVVDIPSYRIRWRFDAAGTPLGVTVLGTGNSVAISRFGEDRIALVGARAGAVLGEVTVGGGPSLLVGPLENRRLLVSSEETDRLVVLDVARFEVVATVPVGARPFPPSATSDGRWALVPAYDGGTVTRVDLASLRPEWSTPVGERPSGGAVLPGDTLYAVAVRGEDRLAVLDVRSGEIVRTVERGIGREPFSVVVNAGIGLAFVNNTASHDVSVFELPDLAPLGRVTVPEIPIVLAVHAETRTLWVTSEGEDALTVLAIPESLGGPAQPQAPAGTDIWTADLETRNGWLEVGPPTRVTDRPGYDNQPHFLPDGRLLYTSIDAAGQADIWQFDPESAVNFPFTRTAPESEYSAELIPGRDRVSVVRVEADSTQRLWSFDLDGDSPALVVEDVAPVGYSAWYDECCVAVYVLGDPPTLRLVNVATGESRVVAERIGRSLRVLPDRGAVAYVELEEDGVGTIRAVDTNRGVRLTLTPTRPGSQDFAVTRDGTLLMAEGSVVFQWTTAGGWRQIADLSEHGVRGITRLAVSPDGQRLALVGER